jgi:hypothetical protein
MTQQGASGRLKAHLPPLKTTNPAPEPKVFSQKRFNGAVGFGNQGLVGFGNNANAPVHFKRHLGGSFKNRERCGHFERQNKGCDISRSLACSAKMSVFSSQSKGGPYT